MGPGPVFFRLGTWFKAWICHHFEEPYIWRFLITIGLIVRQLSCQLLFDNE